MTSAKGLLFILSSPSGGGKSSLSKALISDDNSLKLSISVTTRSPRISEIDGINYIFKTKDEFESLKQQDAFLEYAQIYDNYYGTLKSQVDEVLKLGYDLLFDIDYQGSHQIKEQMPNAISIFIMPPSIAVLEKRLKNRGQDTEEVISKRLNLAYREMNKASEYDHIVVNDDFDLCLENIKAIMMKHRAKRDEL